MTEPYRYRAATGTGELVEGIVHAGSPRDAADVLRQRSMVPVSIDGATRQAPTRPSRAGRRESIAGSMHTVATLLDAGIPLERALDFAARHASHADVRAAFLTIQAEIRRGGALSDALRMNSMFGAFPAAVVHAGEESGTLDQALHQLAGWYDHERELRSQVRSALMYPALMGVVAGIGVMVLLVFVVPRFVAILGDVGGELPLSTRMLVASSTLVVRKWWIWMPLLIGIVLFARWWFQQPGNRQRWHAFRLTIPVAGTLERSALTARFTRALGVLLGGGVSLLKAIRIARDTVTNSALASQLESATERIAGGDRVADAFAGPLPPLAVALLAAGEESGQLPAMCTRVAENHEASVTHSVRGLVRMLEPVLILGFGAIVGFIALAMLQAVYSVNLGVL